jgi:hypothetical protein
MKRTLTEIATDIHRITDPGEYGLGTEPESMSALTKPVLDENADYQEVEAYLEQEKAAWEAVGKLVNELMFQLPGDTYHCALCGGPTRVISTDTISDETPPPEGPLRWRRIGFECLTCADSLAQTVDVPLSHEVREDQEDDPRDKEAE